MISELLDWLAVQLAIWTICRPPWQLRSAAAVSITPNFPCEIDMLWLAFD
jgi:hypothetical protein